MPPSILGALSLGLLAILAIAEPTRGQAYWYEVPVPLDTVTVVKTATPQVYVAQNARTFVLLTPPVTSYGRVDVTINGSTQTIYNGSNRSAPFEWVPAPLNPGL